MGTDRVMQLMGVPRRLHCFVYGYEPIAESLSVPGGDPARFRLEPVTGVAIEYDHSRPEVGQRPVPLRSAVSRR